MGLRPSLPSMLRTGLGWAGWKGDASPGIRRGRRWQAFRVHGRHRRALTITPGIPARDKKVGAECEGAKQETRAVGSPDWLRCPPSSMQFVSRATGARVGGIVEEPSESQRKPDPAQAQSIRTRFLEELLADEEHGRLRPVEDYVARYGEVADFVRTEHDALLHRDAQDAVEDSPVLRPDECVGRYVLRQRLGEGGMGTVFEAFDPDVGRRVVVKTLRWKTNAG